MFLITLFFSFFLFLNNTKGDSKLIPFSKHTRNGVITLLEGAEGGRKESKKSFYYFPLQNSH